MNLYEAVNYIFGQYTRDAEKYDLDLNKIKIGIIKNTVNEILEERYSVYRWIIDERYKLIYRVILTNKMERDEIIKSILNKLKDIGKIDKTVEDALKMIEVRLFQLSERELQEKDILRGGRIFEI